MNFVTGATGLLGTHVMQELLLRGEKVRGLKRPTSDLKSVEQTLANSKSSENLFDKIEWIDGDVLDTESLDIAMTGVTHVYHCAAVVSYHEKDRASMYEVNVEGTFNVVNVALDKKIAKLCFVSSIAALGKVKNNDWLDEESEWTDSQFNTHYGITKNLSELEVWRGIQEGLNAIIVNPGFIIGSVNFDKSSARIFRKLNEGLSYYPPGGTGFVGVKDCAEMMVDLMKKSITGERFILVSENLSMKEVFCEIAEGLSKPPPTKEASEFILQLARFAEWLKEITSGKRALVTSESVKNASVRFYYQNKKTTEFLGRAFTPVRESIIETADFLKNQKIS